MTKKKSFCNVGDDWSNLNSVHTKKQNNYLFMETQAVKDIFILDFLFFVQLKMDFCLYCHL